VLLSIADDGVGLNVKLDPRSTAWGSASSPPWRRKLDASVERDPAHAGTGSCCGFAVSMRRRRESP